MYAGINASMPTYMHMCFHIPVRISKYTNINAYMILHMRASRHLCQHICIYASIHACIYAYMPAYKETSICSYASPMLACIHICHLCIYAYMQFPCSPSFNVHVSLFTIVIHPFSILLTFPFFFLLLF